MEPDARPDLAWPGELGNRRLQAWGERPAVHWLGSRSFALYLTHEPLVVSLQNLLWQLPRAMVISGGIGGSLLLAEAFFRLVEKPSHQFSRLVGRRVEALRPAR